MRIRVSQMTAAWRRREELHPRPQSKRQSRPPCLVSTAPAHLIAAGYGNMLPPAPWDAVLMRDLARPTALAALPAGHDGIATVPPLVLATALGCPRTYSHSTCAAARARGSWRAGDSPISGGPVDGCSRENPPTAVSVFPLPIYETGGSCRFANLSPGMGRGTTGRSNGARSIRCVALEHVTDWEM